MVCTGIVYGKRSLSPLEGMAATSQARGGKPQAGGKPRRNNNNKNFKKK